MREIGRSSFAVELDRQIYFIVLSQDKLKLLVNLAASLSDDGVLPVKKAPADYKFQELEIK